MYLFAHVRGLGDVSMHEHHEARVGQHVVAACFIISGHCVALTPQSAYVEQYEARAAKARQAREGTSS